MAKIYVTRHGQSMTNIDIDIARRDAGHKVVLNTRNNILTETGIEQAIAFGRRLKEENVVIDHIIASPYGRTKQTAFTIASVLATCVDITYEKSFQEIEWDVGGAFDRLENYLPDFDSKTLPYNERPMIDHRRGAITLESQEDVFNRVVPKLITVAKRAAKKDENILIVTHFFVVRAIEAFMATGHASQMVDFSPKNLCMNSYDADDILERITA
jgi:broad specificity phosphatase PhoE